MNQQEIDRLLRDEELRRQRQALDDRRREQERKAAEATAEEKPSVKAAEPAEDAASEE